MGIIGTCYGPNVCVPSKFLSWDSTPRVTYWKWGCEEVVVTGGWSSQEQNLFGAKRNPREPSCFPVHVRTADRWHLWAWKQSFTRHWLCQRPGPGLASLQMCRRHKCCLSHQPVVFCCISLVGLRQHFSTCCKNEGDLHLLPYEEMWLSHDKTTHLDKI